MLGKFCKNYMLLCRVTLIRRGSQSEIYTVNVLI